VQDRFNESAFKQSPARSGTCAPAEVAGIDLPAAVVLEEAPLQAVASGPVNCRSQVT